MNSVPCLSFPVTVDAKNREKISMSNAKWRKSHGRRAHKGLQRCLIIQPVSDSAINKCRNDPSFFSVATGANNLAHIAAYSVAYRESHGRRGRRAFLHRSPAILTCSLPPFSVTAGAKNLSQVRARDSARARAKSKSLWVMRLRIVQLLLQATREWNRQV